MPLLLFIVALLAAGCADLTKPTGPAPSDQGLAAPATASGNLPDTAPAKPTKAGN